MSCKTSRYGVATLVVTLLWFSAGVALGVSDAQRQEISRLAELTHWKSGSIVADIGAGDGSYSFIAAEKVGPSGRVYASEIDSEKLKDLRAEVSKRNLENVTIVEGSADDTKLPSSCCDTIFLRRVYHHLTQPQEFDKNLVRSLKPGAYLAIIDFPPDSGLPAVEGVPKNRAGHGILQKAVVEELTAAGLHLEKSITDWTSHDYCLLFTNPAQ